MRSRILESAKSLFAEDGFQNVSIRKIADKIEYSPATIYLYFKDKDAILFALHNEGFRTLFSRQGENMRIVDPAKRLRALLEGYLDFALDEPEYYDLMFMLFTPLPKILKTSEWRYGRRAFRALQTTIQECQNKGLLKNTSIEAASLGLWGAAHGIAALLLRQRASMLPEDELPALAREGLRMLESHLLPLAPIPSA
ncbi:MAG: TetR/AcrR family transcriptional regulator [Calditrichaeota bacterium]|nr:TetR/AcrR family transcriptional regulator [Calditrichota bacterium]MCB9367049.1 TetR/AcrR family transcriptional regulator [Calditrichota bacterium]MCB9391467.1 TetR/AcrR family transcriptional regulator [Calditrichota bacterium]